MASKVRKGRSGNYYMVWSKNGKQVREPLKTKDQKEAKKRKSYLENQFFYGEYNPFQKKWYESGILMDPDFRLEKLMEEYIQYKCTTRSNKGWGKLRRIRTPNLLGNFVEFVGGDKTIGQLSEKDIENFLWRDTVSSQKTRQSNLTDIKAFWNWCRKKGYVEHKLDYNIKPVQQRRGTYFTALDVCKLANCNRKMDQANIDKGYTKPEMSCRWYGDVWKFMLSTGLRRSEVLKVRCSEVEPKNEVIYFGDHYITKTYLRRNIPFMRFTPEVVDRWLDPTYRSKFHNTKNSDYLFGTCSDAAEKRVSGKFKKVLRKTIPDKKEGMFKELRHSFGYYFLLSQSRRQGQDYALFELSRIMGHKDMDTTRGYLDDLRYHKRLR